MMREPHTKIETSAVEDALSSALKPVAPPRELLARLQTHVRTLRPDRPAALDKSPRPNLTYIGIAGAFTVLMTLAVGFRTAGSIVGGLALLNEVSRQLKSRKSERLTPTG